MSGDCIGLAYQPADAALVLREGIALPKWVRRAWGAYNGQPWNEQAIMKAVWNGTVVAESQDTVIVEGNHYFPLGSVNTALLEPSTRTSVCPWKGTANYYSLNVNGERNPDAVWYYAEPKDAARHIKGRVAFWKGVNVVG